MYTFDSKFRASSNTVLCGIDEAGRGPLAGPVVAAALILPEKIEIAGLNDSKKLSETKRNDLNKIIRTKAQAFGIGVASVAEIEQINILQATFLAMKRAFEALQLKPDFVLVDGRDFPRFIYDNEVIDGQAIVKGDSLSAVIAGASILAKVYRDDLMRTVAREYPQYGFESHKGYGTQLHRDKIKEFGPSPMHRKKFIRKILNTELEETLL